MRLPVLFAVYVVATSAAIGMQPAIVRFHKERQERKPVNSEAALESAPGRHPLTAAVEQPPICVGGDGREFYKGGDLYVCNVEGERRSFIPDAAAEYCAVGDDGTLYLVGSSDKEYWLRAYSGSGELKWTSRTDEIRSPLAVARDGTIYLISMPRRGNTSLTAYGADGTTRWNVKLGGLEWNPVPPAIGPDGTVYVYSGVQSAPEIVAINPQGEKLWSASLPAMVKKLVVAPSGTVLADVPAGHLFAFDPRGHQLWNFYWNGSSNDGLAVAEDGTIYFVSRFVFALDNLGKPKWTFKSEQTYTQGDRFEENPVIAADGTVYAASFNHSMYAITPGGRKKWVSVSSEPGSTNDIMLSSHGYLHILRIRTAWFAVSSGLATHGWPSPGHDARNTRSQESP
jgi:outer membrane protein assembly factor BamB